MIDLRSDTVTKPSAPMRQAIANAPVGDDVYGEDPTVRALEEKAAEMLGKEAALFVASGTQANQICARTHTSPADEIVVGRDSHLFWSECGAVAMISGVTLNLLETQRGLLDADDVAAAVRPIEIHHPVTSLVWIENTHNRGGGTVYPLELVERIGGVAHSRGLALHMDGARIFNAVAASGTSAAEYASHCDSVSFCLSKGLGCPVGSLVVGSGEFVDRARRWRKVLGGGMRQAGILAAAGLYALRNNLARLADDHANARSLAEALSAHPLVKLDPAAVETNIVVVGLDDKVDPDKLVSRADAMGVKFLAYGPQRVRLVTHLDVSQSDAQKAAGTLLDILEDFG